MKITRMRVQNFKSFREVDITFGDMNVVIGSNAAGKSNITDIIRFLRDVESWGLDSAISLQGGCDYMLNLGLGTRDPFYVEIEIERNAERGRFLPESVSFKGKRVGIKLDKFCIKLGIDFEGDGYKILNNQVDISYSLETLEMIDEPGEVNARGDESVGEVILVLKIEDDDLVYELSVPESIAFEMDDLIPEFFLKDNADASRPLFSSPFIPLLAPFGDHIFKNISIFDFDPKKVKASSLVAGRLSLEEDGSNLPVVLRDINKDMERKASFNRYAFDLLAFVKDVNVQENVDRSLVLEVEEKFNSGKYISSPYISDGTAAALAFIAAIHFDRSAIKFFEEPERNMHPSLIRKVLEHMKSQSYSCQTFLTTHNAEIIRASEIEDVVFVSRSGEGFTVVEKLTGRDDVIAFLENEIGLDELYSGNFLSKG